MDFSGWCIDLLRPVRGRADIMSPLMDLCLAITNCDVPLAVFHLITPGALAALHKDELVKQQERAACGKPPRLRPVNTSSLLWKIATQVAIQHHEYKDAAEKLAPLQLGVGAKFGMHRMAFTAQELYAQGWSLAEMDAENGFNRASRQSMLAAIQRNCPSMTRLFWMGYCSHAPLVLMRRGSDFVVMLSSEGSRMGDKFGSFAFCLAVHPAYLAIQSRCPNVVLQAATDDLKGYARDPADLVALFAVAREELRNHAGITLNADKSAILLAPGTPAPVDAHGTAPEGIEFLVEGTIVVGAAVGTDAFVAAHVRSVVDAALHKCLALCHLDAQSALLLLSACLVPALGYHLQVTPPRLAAVAVDAWDAGLDAARSRILSDPALGQTPEVGVGLQQQSHKKARLPFKLGGVGHYSAAIISLTGFYASYAQHVALSAVPDERLLRRELAWVVPALRATIADGHRGLVHAADTIRTSRPMRKLQSLLTRSAHGEAHRLLVATAPVPRDKRMLQFPTDAYLPFLACPTHPSLVIPHEQFISGLRFYLLLPQLLRVHTVPPTRVAPAVDSADFSYQADACRHCDGAVCDRHLSCSWLCLFLKETHQRPP